MFLFAVSRQVLRNARKQARPVRTPAGFLFAVSRQVLRNEAPTEPALSALRPVSIRCFATGAAQLKPLKGKLVKFYYSFYSLFRDRCCATPTCGPDGRYAKFLFAVSRQVLRNVWTCPLGDAWNGGFYSLFRDRCCATVTQTLEAPNGIRFYSLFRDRCCATGHHPVRLRGDVSIRCFATGAAQR